MVCVLQRPHSVFMPKFKKMKTPLEVSRRNYPTSRFPVLNSSYQEFEKNVTDDIEEKQHLRYYLSHRLQRQISSTNL